MKKIIIIPCIIVILLTTLMTGISYAKSVSNLLQEQPDLQNIQSDNAVTQFMNTATAETGVTKYDSQYKGKNVMIAQKQDAKSAALANDQDSFVARVLAGIVKMVVSIIIVPLNWVIGSVSGDSTGFFEIEKLVFNEYNAFSIDFFSDTRTESKIQPFLTLLKESISKWYNAIRLIAIMASLLVLIYIGIRMAISSVASEKAKYKRMLKDWFVSLILVFILHYIIIIIIYLSGALVDLIGTVKPNSGLESDLMIKLYDGEYKGWEALAMSALLLMFVYFQLKFFIIYFKRIIIAAFLIIISPLITITYAIDKADDNKAQAFETWFNEMIITVFIQPMHAILFIIFIVSAGEIAKFSVIVAILVLWALSKGENILRMIFKLNKGTSMGSDSLGNTQIFGDIFSR